METQEKSQKTEEKKATIARLQKKIRRKETHPRLTYNQIKKMENENWVISPLSDTLQKNVCDYLTQKGFNSEIQSIKYLDGDVSVFEATPELVIATIKNSNYSVNDYLIFHKNKNRKTWSIWTKK